jgi:hypothetical protein
MAKQQGRDEKGRFTEKNIWAYVKKNVGRTPKYKKPEELLEKALEYFEWAANVRKGKFNEAHLRMWLGFTRSNWHQYLKRPEFCDTMDYITSFMEGEIEDKLMWAGSTQGAIFKLKNKYGWVDEVTQNQNQRLTEVKVEVIKSDAKLSNNEKDVDV